MMAAAGHKCSCDNARRDSSQNRYGFERDEVRRRVEVVGQVVKTQAQRIGDRVGPKEDVQVVGQVVQTQAQRMICGNL